MENPEGPISTPVLISALMIVAAGAAIDLILDAPRSIWSFHVLFETSLTLVSLGAALYLWRGWRSASRTLLQTQRDLKARIAERDAWQAEAAGALKHYADAIDRQLEAWKLTPVEREVAFHLLRGEGHKQIAGLTGRSERTVRQHAVSIYEKSGLSGRAELAAFFLEGVGLPARRMSVAPERDATAPGR